MKKGQNLSLSTLVIVVLIIIVLFVTLTVFFRFINEGSSDINILTSCEEEEGNVCSTTACGPGKKEKPLKCPVSAGEKRQKCCAPDTT